MLVTEEKPQSDVVIELIEQAVNDQLARVTFGGDPYQFVQAIAWNASRAAAGELARRGLVNSLGPGQHAMVTVDPDRNHGRASITRGMVPINAAVGLLRAGDPLELVREEFSLTEPEVAVVAALASDFQDLAEEQLRPVYRERARLVAVLAALFPAVWAYSDPAAPEWPVVYVDIPQGQCSWHLSAEDLDLFGHVPQVAPDDPRARWDGHTTDEKYQRLAGLARASTGRADAVTVVADALADIKIELGPNTVESIARGMRRISLSGSERRNIALVAVDALGLAVQESGGRG